MVTVGWLFVSGSAAAWRRSTIHQMNRVNSRNGFATMTAPETLSIVVVVLVLLIYYTKK